MEFMLSAPVRGSKRVREAVHTPINELVNASRARIVAMSDDLPGLRAKLQSIVDRVAMMPDQRRYVRIVKDLEKAGDALREQIRHIESGDHLREFEESISEFVRAYHTNESSRRRLQSNPTLPGEQAHTFRAKNASNVQAEVVTEYLTCIDRDTPRISVCRNDVCPRCDGLPMQQVPSKALVACMACGYCASYLDATTSSVSYGEEIEFANFSYKRINHFSEWMTNIQGIETHVVQDEVLDRVCEELFRQRILRPEHITYKKVREVLKTLKMRKQYEHTTQITCRISGRPFPRLSARTQEMCRLMFRACQEPFSRHSSAICSTRKNFMSYSYILFQYLYILGESQDILDAFTLLKGRDKRQRMDEVFSLIAKDLDWDWCPTT